MNYVDAYLDELTKIAGIIGESADTAAVGTGAAIGAGMLHRSRGRAPDGAALVGDDLAREGVRTWGSGRIANTIKGVGNVGAAGVNTGLAGVRGLGRMRSQSAQAKHQKKVQQQEAALKHQENLARQRGKQVKRGKGPLVTGAPEYDQAHHQQQLQANKLQRNDLKRTRSNPPRTPIADALSKTPSIPYASLAPKFRPGSRLGAFGRGVVAAPLAMAAMQTGKSISG